MVRRNLKAIVALSCLIFLCPFAPGQNGNGGGGGQFGGGGQGGGQGAGGGQGNFPGGILINADGVISSAAGQKISPAMLQQQLKLAAEQTLPESLNQQVDLRIVSLVGIDRTLAAAVAKGEPVPSEISNLAGLTSIEYVAILPETNDLVIAGPAEGFAAMPNGRVIGTATGRPVLQLDDLLAMFRLPSLSQNLGCSFDPDPARLAAATAWNKANSRPATPAVARQRFSRIADILGHWNISVFGLPNNSHAALTVVEADLQMKQISYGLLNPGIRGFRSHLAMARPGDDTMKRWWFAPRYEPIEQSEDGSIFRLSGPRLQLLTQDELVDLDGNRSNAAFNNVSSERYTQQFNKNIDALCRRIPSFAATQNIFDLAIAVALIRKHSLAERIDWSPEVLPDSEKLPLRTFQTPSVVPSVTSVKASSRNLLIGLVGGGVLVRPDSVVEAGTSLEDLPTVRQRLGAEEQGSSQSASARWYRNSINR